MARNQKSWGLKFVLASIVLLFCLAVTTVEARSVPFIAQLTPENTGKVNSKNKEYVGQAIAYLANRGRDYRASILIILNIDPKEISNIQLYDLVNKELLDGTSFSYISDGYYALETTLTADTAAYVNIENIAVYVYLKTVGTKKPALSGTLVNNPYSSLTVLKADQEVTTPTGVSKNIGFGTLIYDYDQTAGQYTVSVVVNHDLNEKVTSIALHGPAASNTDGAAIIDFGTSGSVLVNAGKAIKVTVDITTLQYLVSHLTYLKIKTNKNPNGALRGQVIPTTNGRVFAPTFPNTATQGDLTFLPDGSTIFGDVDFGLKHGSARKNLPGNTTDSRVADFSYNVTSASFDNDFRFKLPVNIKNKYSVRGAQIVFSAAADISETGKYNLGVQNLATGATDLLLTAMTATGRRDFANNTYGYVITVDQFPIYLSQAGILVNINGAGLTGDLYVDIFAVVYYVNNAYANNLVKSFFYGGKNIAA